MYVEAAFGAPLREVGVELHAVAPRRGRDVVRGYREALDAALDLPGPLLVGGVSLGAHVVARWAAQRSAGRRSGTVAGLLLALPAWTGDPGDAPAALAARFTAARVRADGVAAALAEAAAGSPRWLAAELGRAWPRYGTGLADALDGAAATPAPRAEELRSLTVPAGIAALVDDPVHPIEVATLWQRLIPRAVLRTATLARFGADPAALGRAAVDAWLHALETTA